MSNDTSVVRSKEEILKSIQNRVHKDFDPKYSPIMEAMDEYADQQSRLEAIAFKKWSDSFYTETGCDINNNRFYSDVSFEDENRYTTDQLYQLFKQQQSKQG